MYYVRALLCLVSLCTCYIHPIIKTSQPVTRVLVHRSLSACWLEIPSLRDNSSVFFGPIVGSSRSGCSSEAVVFLQQML